MDIPGEISKYKSYFYYDDRISSLDAWSPQITPDKYQLARAGFFYSGFGDRVVCFSCDLKLYNWEKTDDPWIEHCTKSPNCLFVKLVGQKTKNTTPMDIQPSYPSSQFVFRTPQSNLKDTNPLFSIFSKESK